MRVEVHKSIGPIREIWDRLAPRNGVALESSHLLAIERSGVNAVDPYYLLVYDDARLAGIVHGFVMTLDVASIDKSVPPDALAALRCWSPDFLNRPIFECGIVSGLGETIAAGDADLPQVCRAAASEMTRLARRAGAEFVLVRDVPYARFQQYTGFVDEGYAPLLGFPIARMAVRWDSFDGYIGALKSITRRDFHRTLSRQPTDISVVHLKDFAAHADRLADLWDQTAHRAADYVHENLNPAYFREVQRCLPDRSRVIALKRGDEILAFALSLVGDREYFAAHCGLDYARAEGDSIYDLLTLSVMKDAFSHAPRSLNWGITTYDFKFKRGFEADPTIYFVKHVHQPRLTVSLARGLQKGIHQPENRHRPFKDQDVASRPDFKAIAASLPVTPPPPTSDLFSKVYAYDRIDSMKLGDIYSFYPAFETAQGPVVQYQGREIVMLGSNAYLGLGTHPSLVAAAKAAIDRYGTGCSGSPLLNGTLDLHVDLARSLAEFMQKDDAILFSTGYQTNVGVVSALLTKDDVVVMDRLVHASLVDGVRMAGADIVRFRHNDMESLEHALKKCQGRGTFVVVDSVFSMEGTLANLPEVIGLAQKYGARTMVDEAHAIGVLGPGGRGGAEHFGLLDKVDVVMGTFSKSFASVGGFVAADFKVVDYLRHVARSHIFSASLPPAAVATVRAALEIIKNEPERRQRVLQNAAYMATRLQSLGFDAPFHGTPVVPVRCDNDVLTLGAFKRLLEKGVFVNPVLEPAVPKGREVLRTSYMATHTEEMLDRALAVFAAVRTPLFPKRAAALAQTTQSAPPLRVRPMVFLPLPNRSSFSDHYVPQSQHGRLRVPGFTGLEIGQAVDCGIAFSREGTILQSQGMVVSRRFAAGAEDPAGIEIELLPTEAQTRDLIEKIVAGQGALPSRRKSWRYHTDIEVELAAEGSTQKGMVDDISLGGAAIHSRTAPLCGTRVSLRLTAPCLSPIEVAGEVRWSHGGHDPAFGVQFQFGDSSDRQGIEALIDMIRTAISDPIPEAMLMQSGGAAH